MKHSIPMGALLFAGVLAPTPALAAICTVSGQVTIASSDNYYCDSTVSGNDCTGWMEWNLDINTPPMRYLQVQTVHGTTGQLLGETWTDTGGNYVVTFDSVAKLGLSSCSGIPFKNRYRLKRVDPTGANPPVSGLFRIVKSDGNATWSILSPQYTFGSSPCGSSVCSARNKLFARTSNGLDRAATVYYTANSALSEAILWSNNLKAQFSGATEATDGTGMVRISFDSSYGTGSFASQAPWMVTLGYNDIGWGVTRGTRSVT